MLWFEILMTELGVGNDKVRGGGGAKQCGQTGPDLSS